MAMLSSHSLIQFYHHLHLLKPSGDELGDSWVRSFALRPGHVRSLWQSCRSRALLCSRSRLFGLSLGAVLRLDGMYKDILITCELL
jgi:hypothetical protein